MRYLRRMGVRFALDDCFALDQGGSSLSSIAYLNALPIGIAKVGGR